MLVRLLSTYVDFKLMNVVILSTITNGDGAVQILYFLLRYKMSITKLFFTFIFMTN